MNHNEPKKPGQPQRDTQPGQPQRQQQPAQPQRGGEPQRGGQNNPSRTGDAGKDKGGKK